MRKKVKIFAFILLTLIHSLTTCLIRKESLIRYNIQSILNVRDFYLLLFLSYQFYFHEKIKLFNLSFFNEYINRIIGRTIIIKLNITEKEIFRILLKRPSRIEKVIFQKPSNIQVIKSNMFSWTSIQSITIPSSVIKICNKAFSNCESLITVEFEENSQLKIIGIEAFTYSSIQKILIPSSVIEINDYAFTNCKQLEKIEFEENSQLKRIGYYAFGGSSIVDIIIPPSVIYIGNDVFKECENLVSVIFSENSNLHKIPRIFDNSSIQYLNIPSNFCSLGKYWCIKTLNLDKIFIPPENEYFESSDINNNRIITGKNSNDCILYFVSRHLMQITIPSYIKHIYSCSFYGSRLDYINFEEDSQLTVIHSFAFCNSLLEYIYFPSSITDINKMAFACCSKLIYVNFPEDSQLKKIGKMAFFNSLLREILIPSKVKYVGSYAFEKCYDLTYVGFSDDSELEVIKKGAFKSSSLIQFSVPKHVKKIGMFSFSNCQYLQIIEIVDDSELEYLNINMVDEYSATIIMIPNQLNIIFV